MSMDLVRRYQDGDPKALEALLSRYQDRIRRIVRIRLGSRLREQVESMDIVQQANMVVMRRLGELQVHDNASILKWLSQIVLNQIRDTYHYFEAERRDVDRVVNLDMDPDDGARHRSGWQLAGDDPLPEEHAWRTELRSILDESMLLLKEDYREIILRRDYIGEDWSTIATEMGFVEHKADSQSMNEEVERAVHAAQARHGRAWIKLRSFVRPRLNGYMGGR